MAPPPSHWPADRHRAHPGPARPEAPWTRSQPHSSIHVRRAGLRRRCAHPPTGYQEAWGEGLSVRGGPPECRMGRRRGTRDLGPRPQVSPPQGYIARLTKKPSAHGSLLGQGGAATGIRVPHLVVSGSIAHRPALRPATARGIHSFTTGGCHHASLPQPDRECDRCLPFKPSGPVRQSVTMRCYDASRVLQDARLSSQRQVGPRLLVRPGGRPCGIPGPQGPRQGLPLRGTGAPGHHQARACCRVAAACCAPQQRSHPTEDSHPGRRHGSCSRHTPGSAQGTGAVGERQRPTAPTAASGTFNPLCRVLCTIRSLYLSAVGPVFILSLATDTPCGSDYTPKQTYSLAQPGMRSGRGAAVIRIIRDYHPVSRAFPGVLAALTATPRRRSPGLSMSLAKPSAHERADGPDDGSPFRRGGTRLCCQFIRHYRSSRDYFLFLCRVICLSSAGDFHRSQVPSRRSFRFDQSQHARRTAPLQPPAVSARAGARDGQGIHSGARAPLPGPPQAPAPSLKGGCAGHAPSRRRDAGAGCAACLPCMHHPASEVACVGVPSLPAHWPPTPVISPAHRGAPSKPPHPPHQPPSPRRRPRASRRGQTGM